MMEELQLKPFLLENKQGRALWHLGALITFKALGAETNGQFWALEGLADRKMAVPLHLHTREDEYWYILEGEFRFTIGEETRIGKPGDFAYIPRNVPHSFQVISETARWFGVGTPAGFDQWFLETGEPAQALTLPPSSIAMPDVDWIVSTLKAYGTETLAPPPGM